MHVSLVVSVEQAPKTRVTGWESPCSRECPSPQEAATALVLVEEMLKGLSFEKELPLPELPPPTA